MCEQDIFEYPAAYSRESGKNPASSSQESIWHCVFLLCCMFWEKRFEIRMRGDEEDWGWNGIFFSLPR